jgi:hypothetical protein
VRWSEAELDLLRDVSLTLAEVAERTGRSLATCKARASQLKIKRRRGAWQPWELALLEDVSVPLTVVAERTGRKLGTVYSEASLRKIGGRVQGKPRQPGAAQKSKTYGPRKPQRNVTPVALCLLRDTSLSYAMISDLTGLDRESLRTAASRHGYANRGQPKGAQAHRWLGGRRPSERTWRGPDWEEFRLAALERDGYTCQDCGFADFTGSGLHVHHIIPWHLWPVNDLRWLVTLCRRCHGMRPEHEWTEIPADVLAEAHRSDRGESSA